MFEAIENAIQAARDAQQEILRVEATPSNRRLLDASYSALSESIRQLSKLLNIPVDANNEYFCNSRLTMFDRTAKYVRMQ